MSKPIIDPIFQEWWVKGNMVVTSNQQREDIRVAFHVGVHVALGLVARANKMQPLINAEEFIKQIMAEVDHVLKPNQVNGKIPVKGFIDGNPLN